MLFTIKSNGLKKELVTGSASIKIPYFITRILLNRGHRIKKQHYKQRTMWLDESLKEQELCKLYEKRVGTAPNLKQPHKFTEKLNWMKLHYKNSLITECCDKYKVKDFVKNKLGSDKFIIPTIAFWDDADKIDFDMLPNQFVLKVNWSSGYNIFVKDKSELSKKDFDEIRRQVKRWMKPESNSYYDSFNWGYKDVLPIVYVEEFLPQEYINCEYKFFVFHGKAEYILLEIETDDKKHQRITLDRDANEVELCFGKYEKAEKYQITDNFKMLLEIAEKLSDEFIFTRVDFYAHEETVYIGEMTFYSGGGFSKISPPEWEYILGNKLKIKENIYE